MIEDERAEAFVAMDPSEAPPRAGNNPALSRALWIIVTTFLPCIPVARFTTRSRLGFAFVFLMIFVLYAGGIACFITATRISEPAITTRGERTNLWIVMALAWGTYLLGPWATLLLQFLWAVVEGLRQRGLLGDYETGTAATVLLNVLFGVQLVFGIVVAALFCKLRLRKPRTCVPICFCSFVACCCPTCAFAHAVDFATNAPVDVSDCEIPAYEL